MVMVAGRSGEIPHCQIKLWMFISGSQELTFPVSHHVHTLFSRNTRPLNKHIYKRRCPFFVRQRFCDFRYDSVMVAVAVRVSEKASCPISHTPEKRRQSRALKITVNCIPHNLRNRLIVCSPRCHRCTGRKKNEQQVRFSVGKQKARSTSAQNSTTKLTVTADTAIIPT